MSVARIVTATLVGLEAERVYTEVDTAMGIPTFTIVGLPDASVNEAKERVRSAIKNSGFDFPLKKILVNLAPADVKKIGTSFDLPVAISILLSAEYILAGDFLESTCFVGELSLDGTLRPIKGVLAIALMCRKLGLTSLVVPNDNIAEASLVEGISVYGVSHLSQLPSLLDDPESFRSRFTPESLLRRVQSAEAKPIVDFADVKGQAQVKRALEIAAAGGHNIALFGPPGSGKSLLAKAFQGILPPMDFEEMLEVSRIYSVSGMLDRDQVLQTARPFRAPHHSASIVGITGGSAHPKPGEITLAHRGVLFMDEFTEFPRSVLEVMRQPIEEGIITVSRANQSVTFPAQFTLLAAMNPCPCGYKGDPVKTCNCLPSHVTRYFGKISGPLMDRIDLQVEVPRLKDEELMGVKLKSSNPAESSFDIRERVIQARNRQAERLKVYGIRTNREMTPAVIKACCHLPSECEAMMVQAIHKFHLTGRSYDRLLKVARTIADLEGRDTIEPKHLAEALQYRGFERLMGQMNRALATAS